jgi:hypothetical protein
MKQKDKPIWTNQIQYVKGPRAKEIIDQAKKDVQTLIQKLRRKHVPWKDIDILLAHLCVQETVFERLRSGEFKQPNMRQVPCQCGHSKKSHAMSKDDRETAGGTICLYISSNKKAQCDCLKYRPKKK